MFTPSGTGVRRLPKDVLNLYVKNDRDEMVPYSAFMTMKERQGPNEITRYNLYPTLRRFEVAPRPAITSGDAIKAVQEVAAEVLAARLRASRGRAFRSMKPRAAMRRCTPSWWCCYFVYLVLAAQYESCHLAVRRGAVSASGHLLGSFFLLKLMGLANDLYHADRLVLLVGLLGKNAVLIVEFAVQKHHEGTRRCWRLPLKAPRCAFGRS